MSTSHCPHVGDIGRIRINIVKDRAIKNSIDLKNIQAYIYISTNTFQAISTFISLAMYELLIFIHQESRNEIFTTMSSLKPQLFAAAVGRNQSDAELRGWEFLIGSGKWLLQTVARKVA